MRAKIRNLPIVSYTNLFSVSDAFYYMKHRLLQLLMVCVLAFPFIRANAQYDNTIRRGGCRIDSLCIRLDTLSIVPSSFHIQGVSESQVALDPVTSILYISDSALLGRQISYSYTVFGYDYSKPRSHKNMSMVESARRALTMPMYSLPTVADMLQEESLVGTGFVSRGVTVGNNQDFVLNSALNIQLVGKLSDDIEVVASISDKNIPVQPEGNTLMLSNINNIFITLKYRNIATVNAGDIGVSFSNDDYLRVQRDLLGLKFDGCFSKDNVFVSKNSVGGGLAKGKFKSQKINVSNGVQGPYKLYGEGNEIGIVVVAGSERVYVDGELLLRGQDNDYTIDYNTAEITFTSKMLVTTEKRIVVEFEYTDRHYSRYNLFTLNEFRIGKKQRLKFNVNYYQEQDMKNQSIQPELTDEHKLFMAALGDQAQQVGFASADSTHYMTDYVLYCKVDTVVDGISYQNVYLYTQDTTRQLYTVNFSYMGDKKGDYILSQQIANGRVFTWIAPVDGVPQGDYAPVLMLTTPKLTQMATIGAAFHWKRQSFVQSEFALSNYDMNTFSKKDGKDNVGYAFGVRAGHQQLLGKSKDTSASWRLQTTLDWQFVQKNFHALERYREVEFARNYNLNDVDSSAYSEQMLQASIALSKSDVSTSSYTFNWYDRLGQLYALRQLLKSSNQFKFFDFGTQTSLLFNRDDIQKSRFIQTMNYFTFKLGKLNIGVKDNMEHNLFKDVQMDTIRGQSYAFNDVMFFVKSQDSSRVRYEFSYKNRVEYLPGEELLQHHLLIQDANALLTFANVKNQLLSLKGTYRNQKLMDTTAERTAEHYYVGSLEYNGRFFRNALVLNTYYEMGSGMELQKSFTYLKVAKGQGTHVWNDYNGNGVEELDEFEVAAYVDEADYIKVWLPGTSYINTYCSSLTQSVQLRPAAVWSRSSGFKKFLSRFTDVAMLRTQQKCVTPMLNPFYFQLEDTNLVNSTFSLTNTFSMNNSSSKFAFDFIVQKLQNKSLLYYGVETNGVDKQQVVLKSTPFKGLYLQTDYAHVLQQNNSDYMIGRRYCIEQHQATGSIQVQIKNSYVATISYGFSDKKNRLGEEHITRHELQGLFNYKASRKGVVTAQIQYVRINGGALENNAVAYQMLNGLALGNNAIWTLAYQVSLSEYLQMSLQYDGRKSEGHKAVHTGNVSLKAQF